MKTTDKTTQAPIRRICRNQAGALEGRNEADLLLIEEPLRIVVNDRDLALLMRTPGNDLELAVGFVLTEGVVKSPEEIASVKQCGLANGSGEGATNTIRLWTVDGTSPKLPSFREVRTSCSFCGMEEIDAVLGRRVSAERERSAGSEKNVYWAPEDLLGLTDALQAHQPLFKSTGAAHGAALFDRGGKLLALGEDIGRHNALDKAIGTLAWRRALRNDLALALSSRFTFEMAVKAWRGGVRNVVAVSAASSMAVEFARRAGLQLGAFARGKGLNLFAPKADREPAYIPVD